MDTVPYTMRRRENDVTVEAVEPVPGLFVYTVPPELRVPDQNYNWRIGHKSGLLIACFEYQADAMTAAKYIAGFTNWDRTAGELLADPSIDPVELRDLIEEDTPGVFVAADPVATA